MDLDEKKRWREDQLCACYKSFQFDEEKSGEKFKFSLLNSNFEIDYASVFTILSAFSLSFSRSNVILIWWTERGKRKGEISLFFQFYDKADQKRKKCYEKNLSLSVIVLPLCYINFTRLHCICFLTKIIYNFIGENKLKTGT